MPKSARGVVEAEAPGRATRVLNGETHLGWLSLFGINAQTDGELLLRLTAAAIGVELARDGAPRSRHASFWSGSVSKSQVADVNASARGSRGSRHYAGPQYCVVVLETDAPAASSSSELQALASQAFAGDDAERGFCQRDQRLYAFVPAPRAVDASNARMAARAATAFRGAPQVGARNLRRRRHCGKHRDDSPQHRDCRRCARHRAARARRRACPVIRCVGRLPTALRRRRRRRACAPSPIRCWRRCAPTTRNIKRNSNGRSNSISTSGQNVKTASERLNVHRHTVFYRLRQIAEISSRSLDSAAGSTHLSFRDCGR